MEADTTLMELLEGLHDPCAAKGKRHPLPALLALAVVAMLAGMTSYEAIVQYGQERGGEFLRLLGFTRRRGLCKATYSRVFRRLDVAAFEAAVAGWIVRGWGRAMRRHLRSTARPSAAAATARPRRPTSWPPTPRTSRPSWPRCGSTPRPTS